MAPSVSSLNAHLLLLVMVAFAIKLSTGTNTSAITTTTPDPNSGLTTVVNNSSNHGNVSDIEETDDDQTGTFVEVAVLPDRLDFTRYPQYAVALILSLVILVALGSVFFMCPDGWTIESVIEGASESAYERRSQRTIAKKDKEMKAKKEAPPTEEKPIQDSKQRGPANLERTQSVSVKTQKSSTQLANVKPTDVSSIASKARPVPGPADVAPKSNSTTYKTVLMMMNTKSITNIDIKK